MTLHYLNLSNGIQALDDYALAPEAVRYLRIPSTWCEQKLWADVLGCASDDLLMNLALGRKCRVYDYGANKPAPRALWQGLEWIRYVLHRRWLGEEVTAVGRASGARGYFAGEYARLGRRDKARIDYYARYLATETIRLVAVAGSTDRDGSAWYAQRIKSGTAVARGKANLLAADG